jgi:hypothetical protein
VAAIELEASVQFPFETPSVTNRNPDFCGSAGDIAVTFLQGALEGGKAAGGGNISLQAGRITA